MATKCQTSVQDQIHLYCPISFACQAELAIGEEREIRTTEDRGSVRLLLPLYYSYQPPQSHKKHTWLVAQLQTRQPNSQCHYLGSWCGMAQHKKRPLFESLISGQQMGNRQKWKGPTALQRVMERLCWERELELVDVIYIPRKCPQLCFSLLTGTKFVMGSHLYFIPYLTFGSFPSVCPSALAWRCPSLLSVAESFDFVSFSATLFYIFILASFCSSRLLHPLSGQASLWGCKSKSHGKQTSGFLLILNGTYQ